MERVSVIDSHLIMEGLRRRCNF